MREVHWSWPLLIAAAIPLPIFGFPLYWAISSLSWISILLLLVYAWVVSEIYPEVAHYYLPEREKGHCENCGYDLTGNESGVCPECGQKIKRGPIIRLPW